MNGEAGKGSAIRRGTDWKKFGENFSNIFRKREVISDGCGNEWKKCEREDCGLEVVRPGKVQCHCDHEGE